MLQSDILLAYRLATTKDVRSWSFGAIASIRVATASSWREQRGSLDDQAIFGPLRDFVCACGKYADGRHKGFVCDRCGVKVTSADVRRARCGHVDFACPTAHPLAIADERIAAFSVLPAALLASEEGSRLAGLYEELVRANLAEDTAAIAPGLERVCEVLAPPFEQAHRWNLREADALARGLGLVRKTDAAADDRCDACGYPLSGLTTDACPGCAKKVERA